MKAILDTSLLIATDVEPLKGELAIGAASLVELHVGVLVTSDPGVRAERLRRLSLLQRTSDALPVDDGVATSYGQLAAAVAAAGRQPRWRVTDILIAATATPAPPRLYTRHVTDLAGIKKGAEQWTENQVADFTLDDELVALLDEVFLNAVPVGRTLLRLLEERGWTGWTKLQRTGTQR